MEDAQGQHACQRHGQPTVVYCKDCEKPLCGDCLAEHKRHNYLTLQEIESEVVPLMLRCEERGEALLKSLQEHHERLVNRIGSIRAQQEEREEGIKNYMRIIEGMMNKKHREMISVEEEMVSKLIPLSFKVERQITMAKQEIAECKARVTELQALKQSERMWKAFHIMLEKKVYAFEEDQNVQQQQAEALLQIGEGVEVPLGVLFEQIPVLDSIGLDPKKVALKSEKMLLKEIIKKLSSEFVELDQKHQDLLSKLSRLKGTVSPQLDLRSTNKQLEERVLTATRRIQELEALVSQQDQETGFMRPRLAQARRVFKSPYANFCSRCVGLCTSMDLLKCGHFLCFHCQASEFPCGLCNSKDKYGKSP